MTSSLFQYLKSYIEYRIKKEQGEEEELPTLSSSLDEAVNDNSLSDFIAKNEITDEEVMLLLLTLVPHIDSRFLLSIVEESFPTGSNFPEFGGIKTKNQRGIIPTGETALYLLAGTDYELRLQKKKWLLLESSLFTNAILSLGAVDPAEPILSGALILDEEYAHLFTTGTRLKPSMSQNFPAEEIQTALGWEHLILNHKTLDEIKEIQTWLEHNNTLLNEYGLKGIIKPGYRVMFYGAPGTGKTLTAMLLGKFTNRPVYRIDLSMVVSKYIGETEKNLANLFNKAANRDWILFFDEADAIFGKRTNVKDAHDKYANQEVSYLLQKIESHPGLVILASNLKNNIDAAFSRRFQSIIEFKLPSSEERKQLWNNTLPKEMPLEDTISIDEISRKYEITGANIVNIVQYACLQKMKKDLPAIAQEDLLKGIKREYEKEGKMI